MTDMNPTEQAIFDEVAGKTKDDAGGHELINIHDHEIMECEKVLNDIAQKQGKSVDLESFRQEVVGRFAEIGLVVNVKVYESGAQPGAWEFDIEIAGRTEKLREGFDHERQQWEVRGDILELGEGGVIKMDGSIMEA